MQGPRSCRRQDRYPVSCPSPYRFDAAPPRLKPLSTQRTSHSLKWSSCILNRGTYRRRGMTQLDVSYRYINRPDERIMGAIDNMREVYGVRRISFNEKEQ